MTSVQTSFSTRLREGGEFNESERVVITERAKQALHNELLKLYSEKQKVDDVGPTVIGRRIGRDPSRINRALNYSSNMTITTIALMAAALGRDLKISFPAFREKRNYDGLTSSVQVEKIDMSKASKFSPLVSSKSVTSFNRSADGQWSPSHKSKVTSVLEKAQ